MEYSLEGYKKASKKDQGMMLLIVGIVLFLLPTIVGIVLMFVSNWVPFIGLLQCCIWPVSLVGFVMIIVGIVYLVTAPSTPVAPAGGAAPPPPPGAAPPPAGQPAPPPQGGAPPPPPA